MKDRLAAYKAIQEAGEALLDIVARRVADAGHSPKDDYTNVGLLQDHGGLSKESADVRREFNGLRSRLVHEYDGLLDELALSCGERLLPGARVAIQEVREWLSKTS